VPRLKILVREDFSPEADPPLAEARVPLPALLRKALQAGNLGGPTNIDFCKNSVRIQLNQCSLKKKKEDGA